jgi:hypothetical protein
MTELKDDQSKRDKINTAKKTYPRGVKLVVLKNRFGEAYKEMNFKYYPPYEFFDESKEKTSSSSEQIEPKNKQSSNSHDSKKRRLKKLCIVEEFIIPDEISKSIFDKLLADIFNAFKQNVILHFPRN